MKEKEIKVLRVKPHEHPEVYMLKNTLEAKIGRASCRERV